MANSYTVHEKFGTHKLVENMFTLLEDFGAYMPHMNCTAVPVCSVETRHAWKRLGRARGWSGAARDGSLAIVATIHHR